MGSPSNPETPQTQKALDSSNQRNDLMRNYLNSLQSNPFGTYNPETGGYTSSDPLFSGAARGYSSFADTGGVDPSAFAGADKVFSSLASPTGGVDPSLIDAAGGWGTFKTAATSPTGLVSQQMINDTRGRTQSQVASFWNAMRDKLTAENAAGGNMTPGIFSAGVEKASEDAALQGRNATLDTELGLNQEELASREWGAGAGASNANALAATESANRRAGGQGLAGTEEALARLTQGGKEFGVSGETGLADMLIKSLMGVNSAQSGEAANFLKLLTEQNPTQKPWWQQLLGGAASIMPALMGGGGGGGGSNMLFGGAGGTGSTFDNNVGGEGSYLSGGGPGIDPSTGLPFDTGGAAGYETSAESYY